MLDKYGVLKGIAKEYKRDSDSDPHSELLMLVKGEEKFRIAINVRSSRGPTAQRLVEYLIREDMEPAVLNYARALDHGWHSLKGQSQSARGVDYVRNNMFRAEDMTPLTHTKVGPDNDLFEKVEDLFQHAIDANATVYVYGGDWGPESNKEDLYFQFLPGRGVHLIHMNQGDSENANGTYQDGAIFVDFPDGRTTGLFIKFQNQAWHTDEEHGTAIADAPAPNTVVVSDDGTVQPWDVVPSDSPYHLARIVGAMVNPAGSDEGNESVTIFNTSEAAIDLKNWKILDMLDRADALSGVIEPGHARTCVLTGNGALLGNNGGTITLLDPRGLKVDGVSYSKKDAKSVGRGIVF